MTDIQRTRRKIAYGLATCYFLLPYLKINGESAFRFDVPSLQLHFFGITLWMQEFFFVTLASLFFALLFLIITLIFGRVWCGWLCPQTILTDLTEKITRWSRKNLLAQLTAHFILVTASLLTGFTTVCYFVSPYKALPQLLEFDLGPIASGTTLVIGILTYLNLIFIRRTFCATICPYAKIQGALTDSKSLIIAMDEERKEECIECNKCLRVCPTGLDIRNGMQIGCIMCAACIDACTGSMHRFKKKSLIRYRFGILKEASLKDLFRPTVMSLVILALIFFGTFLLRSVHRTSFDFNLLPHPMEPQYTKDGEVINGYIISIKNLSRKNIMLQVSLSEQDKKMGFRHSAQDPLPVSAGMTEKYPLFLQSKNLNFEEWYIRITLKKLNTPDEVVAKNLYFTKP